MNVGQLAKLLNGALVETPDVANLLVVVKPRLGFTFHEQGELMSISFQIDETGPKLFLYVKEKYQHIPSPPPSYDHPH